MVEHFNKPNGPGWYWFLPDENCETPAGYLRPDKPIVVKVIWSGTPSDLKEQLAAMLPFGAMWVDELSGDWDKCPIPRRIHRKARKRQQTAQQAKGAALEDGS